MRITQKLSTVLAMGLAAGWLTATVVAPAYAEETPAPTTQAPTSEESASPDADAQAGDNAADEDALNDAPAANETKDATPSGNNPSADELRDKYFPATEGEIQYVDYRRGYEFDFSIRAMYPDLVLEGDLTVETRNGKNVMCSTPVTQVRGTKTTGEFPVRCEIVGDSGPVSIETRTYFTMPDGEQIVVYDWAEVPLYDTAAYAEELRKAHFTASAAEPTHIEQRKGFRFNLAVPLTAEALPHDLVIETRGGENVRCAERGTAGAGDRGKLEVPCEVIADGGPTSIEYRVFFVLSYDQTLVIDDWKRFEFAEQQAGQPGPGAKNQGTPRRTVPRGGHLADTGGPALIGVLGAGLVAAASGVGLMRRRG